MTKTEIVLASVGAGASVLAAVGTVWAAIAAWKAAKASWATVDQMREERKEEKERQKPKFGLSKLCMDYADFGDCIDLAEKEQWKYTALFANLTNRKLIRAEWLMYVNNNGVESIRHGRKVINGDDEKGGKLLLKCPALVVQEEDFNNANIICLMTLVDIDGEVYTYRFSIGHYIDIYDEGEVGQNTDGYEQVERINHVALSSDERMFGYYDVSEYLTGENKEAILKIARNNLDGSGYLGVLMNAGLLRSSELDYYIE
jgi:hypothetical protein